MAEHVLSAITEGVLRLTLNRPDKQNALTEEMYAVLAERLEGANADPEVRVILIQSRGDAFTAGNDIASFERLSAGAQEPMGPSNGTRFIKAIAACAKPVVAGVRGQAAGVGLMMLLHCDVVIVAEDARLSAPFVNLGLVPEAASSRLLSARLGHVRAFSVFTGQVIFGDTAAQWGLANHAVTTEDVDAEAEAWAQALATRPLQSLIATKRLMRDEAAISEQIDVEMAEYAIRVASPEARQAFQAFAARRTVEAAKL